jgi:hypothetical protein
MLNVSGTGSEITAMQNTLDLWSLSLPYYFLVQKQRAARAMVSWDHGDVHTFRAWYFNLLLKLQADHPLRVDA